MKAAVFAALILATQATWGAAAQAPVAFDHVWIMVSPGAPERKALVESGFTIARAENLHEGQGTASITVEFQNGFLELVWLDPRVSVAPGREVAIEKFRNRAEWRTSGWSPISVGLRRTSATDVPLPWPVWTISGLGWLREGESIEMLTPRDKGTAPSVFVPPRSLYVDEQRNLKIIRAGGPDAVDFEHANGTWRITGIKVFAPHGSALEGPPTADLERMGIAQFRVGESWLLQLTLDNRTQGKHVDFQPGLPLVIEY
jgi:hypothetical protein